MKLSLIDFATIYQGERPRDSFQRSVALAQQAEAAGFSRVWYAEHHNMPTISSSAPAVLISHVGAHTSTIRLGAGGVMLPNHSPYTIAEQFGTLAELYPGRIDLGLGRAPGTDHTTLAQALRRSPHAAQSFPEDVVELYQYLNGTSSIAAIPGAGTNVPLYILGSSLFGAHLAAKLGLPFGFASHFAPTHLDEAIRTYHDNFVPSQELDAPYVIAAVNVVAADTLSQAHEQLEEVKRHRLRAGRNLSDDQLRILMNTVAGQRIDQMLKYTAIGNGEVVRDYLTKFQRHCGADELMVSLLSTSWEDTMRAVEITSLLVS
ncbi:LLM class flavin-dependent oxidoreductase [Corynebacterium diphtheriae]|nr:LLM class flavin-dependent oxidoreductase [Corynebacterium diphtheriae]